MKKIEILLVMTCCVVLTSCFSFSTLPTYNQLNNQPNDQTNYELNKRSYIDVKVFQTLSNHHALAWDNDYNVVSLYDDSQVFYDGKLIRGYWVMTDTYSYETKDDFTKTVPSLVPYIRNGKTQKSTSRPVYEWQ